MLSSSNEYLKSDSLYLLPSRSARDFPINLISGSIDIRLRVVPLVPLSPIFTCPLYVWVKLVIISALI